MTGRFALPAIRHPKQGGRGQRPRVTEMNRRTASVGAFALMVLTTVTACKRDEARAESAAANHVVVGPENVAVVRLQDVRTGPSLSGSLQPEQDATVRAELSAAVIQTFVDVGQRVERGTLLARLDDRASRTLLSAQTAVTTAQNNYRSGRELHARRHSRARGRSLTARSSTP